MSSTTGTTPHLRRPRTIALGILWLLFVVGSHAALLRHGAEPGQLDPPPDPWPASVDLPRAADRPTLLLFAHPRCPCTRATLAELERAMTTCDGKANVVVLFHADPAIGPADETTVLQEAAATLPGVRVLADPFGALARSFAVSTSGTALLYAADGRLLFHGGLTAARGHEGDSLGVDAIVGLLTTGSAPRRTAPVYGCALHAPVAAGATGR